MDRSAANLDPPLAIPCGAGLFERPRHRLLQAHVDGLASVAALALEQREQNPHHGVGGGRVIRLQPEPLERSFTGKAVGEHHSAGGLRDEVGRPKARVGPAEAERRDADDDQSWVGCARRFPVEPMGQRLMRRRGIEPHVGARDQLAQALAVGAPLCIDDHALLAGVVELEKQTVLRVGREERRNPASRRSFWRLDLPHLRAEVREQPAGKLRGEPRGFHDTDGAQHRLRHG